MKMSVGECHHEKFENIEIYLHTNAREVTVSFYSTLSL